MNDENVNEMSSFEKYFEDYPGMDNAYVVTLTNGKTFSGTLVSHDDEGIVIEYVKQHRIRVWINRDNICSMSGIVSSGMVFNTPRSNDNYRRRPQGGSVKTPFYMSPEVNDYTGNDETDTSDSDKDDSE